MKKHLLFLFLQASYAFADAGQPTSNPSLDKQNEELFQSIQKIHNPTPEQMEKIKAIFKRSGFAGQGNPKPTKHPMTKEQCQEKLKQAGVNHENAAHESICGGKYMAPLYADGKQTEKDAKTCIDKFEFPNMPCEYPVVWVRANEAVEICEALGKRMCDAHEWEGACAGDLREPDYDFTLANKLGEAGAFRAMRSKHNSKEKATDHWSYGKTYRKGICGSNSTKDSKCNGGNWNDCGSNTYPTGAFPECKSPFDVYDIHGNAAEHMNLPVRADQMASAKNGKYGHTEMKGSWFIFDKYKAHEDSCRWRAPYWHGSKVMDKASHHNYHLGFRCCKSL